MKVKVPTIVKEQAQFTPDLPAKHTAFGSSWTSAKRKSDLKEQICYKTPPSDFGDMPQDVPEHGVGLARDLGYGEHLDSMNQDVIPIQPREDTTDNLFAEMPGQPSDNYDRTMNENVCRAGYLHQPLGALAPEYTGQHATIFYDEVESDGVTGFLERGNFLDRI